MKMLVRCSEDSDDIIDVSEYNAKLEDLHYYVLHSVPFKPTRNILWGRGMNYNGSNQPQVYSSTFEWSPEVVDGGFELSIDVNSFNIASSIKNPPDVTCKIMTFMKCRTSEEFEYAADKLSKLFRFADEIRDYIDTVF